MKAIITLLFPFLFASISVKAQVYLEPFAGLQTDLTPNKFSQLNTGVQLSLTKTKKYEFVIQLQRSWPLNAVSNDSAFTSNPALLVYSPAKKTIRPTTTSFAVGHRIAIAGTQTPNIFYILLYTGVSHQRIQVSYDYDKKNYTVLNPDRTRTRTGLYVGGGVEYMRLLQDGRLFFQLVVTSPPWGKRIPYPSSFNFMGPLALNAGYSFSLKKN